MKTTKKQEAEVVAEPDFSGLTPEQYGALVELELADRARGEGPEAVYAWAELEFGVKPAAFHREWVEEIFANKRVAITAPPEAAKTTWGIIVISWMIGKYPWRTNGVCSAGDSAALKIAQKIADVIEKSRMWAMVFPGVKPDAGHWSREGWEVTDTLMAPELWRKRTATKKDPTLLAGGVGSAVWSGKRITGILWFDDIHDQKSRTSAIVCQEAVDFVQFTGLPRVKKNARAVIVQTRWNPKDVIAYVKTLRSFKLFIHPAIKADDTSYWPEQWPLERLEDVKREIGAIAFDLVYQGNDKALQGTILKAAWLIDFPQTLIKREWPRYLAADFAQDTRELLGTASKDPDDFAMAVLVDASPILIVEDGYAERVAMGDAEEAFFQYVGIYQPVRCGVEVNNRGVNFYSNLLKRMRLLGMRIPILPITTVANKTIRFMEMSPYFQTGQIKVSDALSPFMIKFREQWVSFGNRAEHDDTLDGVYLTWRLTSHLLPSEPPEETRRRLSRPAPVPIAKVIENAYF